MVVEKIIENGMKIAIGAAYTALIGTATVVFVSGQKRSNERTRMATKRQAVDLPGYSTVEEVKKACNE